MKIKRLLSFRSLERLEIIKNHDKIAARMLQQSKNLERKQNNQILQDSLPKYLKQSNENKTFAFFSELGTIGNNKESS